MLDMTKCIEPINTEHYPQTVIAGKKMKTSRLVAQIFLKLNPLDTLTHVCHTCDNIKCINPAHLFLGTAKDNIQDCKNKGRDKKRTDMGGEGNLHAKLTEEQVLDIRRRAPSLPVPYGSLSELAKEFNVSNSTISSIIRRRTWRHI